MKKIEYFLCRWYFVIAIVMILLSVNEILFMSLHSSFADILRSDICDISLDIYPPNFREGIEFGSYATLLMFCLFGLIYVVVDFIVKCIQGKIEKFMLLKVDPDPE